FAGATLSHQPHHFPLGDVEAHMIHGVHALTLAQIEVAHQLIDPEQTAHVLLSSASAALNCGGRGACACCSQHSDSCCADTWKRSGCRASQIFMAWGQRAV